MQLIAQKKFVGFLITQPLQRFVLTAVLNLNARYLIYFSTFLVWKESHFTLIDF